MKIYYYILQNKKSYKIWIFYMYKEEIILRGRISLYYFSEGEWYMPKGYGQLYIILFKDFITKKKLPLFYILMSNRWEDLYKKFFSSLIGKLTQKYIYTLPLISITTDIEYALIKAIQSIFLGVKYIGYWYHLKANLNKFAKSNYLLNKKKKK